MYESRGYHIGIAVDSEPGYGSRPDLWPSVGEYPLYDSFLYHSMSNDAIRNDAFRRAFIPAVGGRRVIDLGTGRNLHWALEAARNGASHVTAIEADALSHAVAARKLAGTPEADLIELIHGVSHEVSVSRRAQVCIAELIGSIASSEGMLHAMADAHARLLTDDAVVVPIACQTLTAAVSLRALFPGGLGFSLDAVPYLLKIFELSGEPFDVRLAVANPDPSCLLSNAKAVEALRFDRPQPLGAVTEVRLDIRTEGQVDGLLCWIQVDSGAGVPLFDSLSEKTCWTPVYLPLFDDPVAGSAGDTLAVRFERTIGTDGIHPDYEVQALMTTAAGISRGSFFSPYLGGGLGTAGVYRELFR